MRKIFESTATHHGQGVTCAVLGPRTGSVLATGGRDKEICLWSLSERNPLHTMTGFVSQVECVLFSWSELEIAGGNTSGAVKIWDIRKGQTLCSFAGHHRGKVKCLAQSQFEDNFWASGAFDGHVKLWDARSCQLVATYRGHSNKTVTSMEFSPDGRWIVTGGEDCMIKLWDITAGKMLSELSGHSGSITAVQFHPNEYLLASSSHDKTVRFWDMETFECVSQSAPDSAGPVKCILFDPSGRCLYSASSGGGLRVLGWEPARLFDSESCPTQWSLQWQGVTALAMAGSVQSVIAACLDDANDSESAVHVFSVDATRLRPIYASVSGISNDELANNNEFCSNNPMRRSFHRQTNDSTVDNVDSRLDNTRGGTGQKYDRSDCTTADEPLSSTVTTDEHKLAFTARPKLARSPPITPVPSDPTTTHGASLHHTSEQNLGATFTVVAAVPPQRLNNAPLGRMPSPARPTQNATKGTSSTAATPLKAKNTATVPPMNATNNSQAAAGSGRKVVHEVTPQVRTMPGLPSSKSSIPLAHKLPSSTVAGRSRELGYKETAATSHCYDQQGVDENNGRSVGNICTNEGGEDDASPNQLGRTFTLAPEDFIPKEQSSAALSATFTLFQETTLPSSASFGPPAARTVHFANQTMTVVSEDDCFAAVEKACRSMSVVLDHRQGTLAMCRSAWRNRGPLAAMELACQMNDPSVVVDLLNILNFRSNIWKLDLCVAVLPQLRQLLDSKYDTYVHTAVNSLRLVLRGFGQIIKNGLHAGNQVPSIGVDISLEERVSKCQKCYNELLAIREHVQRKNKLKGDSRSGRNAHSYRELSLLMSSLDV